MSIPISFEINKIMLQNIVFFSCISIYSLLIQIIFFFIYSKIYTLHRKSKNCNACNNGMLQRTLENEKGVDTLDHVDTR